MREGAVGAMLRAPRCLCSSLRALMKEPGALRGVNGARLLRASDGQKPPVVPRLQRLRVGGRGVLAGVPQLPAAQRPRGTCCLVWPRSHAHPGCAPLWCPLSWGLSRPLAAAAAERIAP